MRATDSVLHVAAMANQAPREYSLHRHISWEEGKISTKRIEATANEDRNAKPVSFRHLALYLPLRSYCRTHSSAAGAMTTNASRLVTW